MQSLRSNARRPSQSKQAKQPQKLAKPSKDARKSRVEDKIKKRISMRYADISAPTRITGVPPVPTLPTSSGSLRRTGRDEDVASSSEADLDLSALERSDFDPDSYLKVKLANSTEAQLQSLESVLKSSQTSTTSELRSTVFKHYSDFVLVSKDISSLENDMLELKESINEWKSMPSMLNVEDTTLSTADRRRVQRSSVADLRILYASQMQTLHATIEGSAKFIPALPGRHVVAEMDDICLLNPATYRLVHTVRFILLNDALLVARKRKLQSGETGKLVAERCWLLNEMVVLDTKDTPSLTNVFKIRHAKDVQVYRTEQAADKKNILLSFRKAAEELSAKRRKEREGEHERRRSMWSSADRFSVALDITSLPEMPDWMADVVAKEGIGGAKQKSERDARWVGDFTDDLTVAIALRDWDRAVELVEKGEARLPTTPLLGPKLPPLKTLLTNNLLHSLEDRTLRKSAVVYITSLLLRLRTEGIASRTFLEARTKLIQSRIRMIRYEGDISLYISDLSIVVFTSIKHTADWYLASFKDHNMASYLVDWVKSELDTYVKLFRQQVQGFQANDKTLLSAFDIARGQSKRLLSDHGLDFAHLLDRKLSLSDESKEKMSSIENSVAAISTQSIKSALASPIDGVTRSSAIRSPPPPPSRSRDRPMSGIPSPASATASNRHRGMI